MNTVATLQGVTPVTLQSLGLVLAPPPERNLLAYSELIAPGITLVVDARKVVRWPDFIRDSGPRSIALDGYVYGKPAFSAVGPHRNFNHHEEVDRLGTSSTCLQVLTALQQGFIEAFSKDGKPSFQLYVNDPDQDVCLSVWLMKNHERVSGSQSCPIINRLVNLTNRLDITAGSCRVNPNCQTMRELAWIYEPYTAVRNSGALATMGNAEVAAVIAAVGNRITEHTLGRGQDLSLDCRFTRHGGGPGWSLISEDGPYGRMAYFHQGGSAYVAFKLRADGNFTYSIGKIATETPFPIVALYSYLNGVEGLIDGAANSWGGSDTIGGSPRVTGSRLKPEEITALINTFIGRQALFAADSSSMH